MGEEKHYKLGIDIGGTFTDFTLVDTQTNNVISTKVSTVPANPEEGIRNGIRRLKEQYAFRPKQLDYLVHGMTIGINTLLQRHGSKIALFVTEGFRDILTIQRMKLPFSFDFHSRLPEPLVPRNMVFGIPERIDAKGKEIIPLDTVALNRAVDTALIQGAAGIAVCFLHSFAYPEHEQQALEEIRRCHPALKVSLSSILWPEIREYERASVTIINLYIQKNVENYFTNLHRILVEEGIYVNPFITQSNGGIMDLDSAAEAPVRTLFSGPAGGVIGAIHEADSSGKKDLLTLDMGGTSTDVSVVLNGEPTYSQKCTISGFPVMLPTIDVRTVGAGGGSVAWVDNGGLLRVGPVSAGSDPGPACYGKGEQPTVTDAYLLCGYLNTERFAGGTFALDRSAAEKTVDKLAAYFGRPVIEIAGQIIQIAVSNMYVEISNILEEKGLDPRDLTIVAYGGSGSLVANYIAEEIHAKDILIPHKPGTLCALGDLSANFTYDAVAPYHKSVNETDMTDLVRCFNELKIEANSWLDGQKMELVSTLPVQLNCLFDARYKGQSYEIQTDAPDELLQATTTEALKKVFNAQHRKQYGHDEPDNEIEIINLRVRIVAVMPRVETAADATVASGTTAGKRKIYVNGKAYEANIFQREQIGSGAYLPGPAVVEQDDTTVLILPNWHGVCLENGNILISCNERSVRQ